MGEVWSKRAFFLTLKDPIEINRLGGMRILISNDDGIESQGILRLAEMAKQLGEVTVVAPHRERSTSGHSLTLHKPLRIIEVRPGYYAATGTPADCIYLGIHQVLKQKPDLILSGINAGANLGTDIHYSGTVAAAREGALMNIKSFAFSMVYFDESPFQYEMAAEYALQVLKKMHHFPFPNHSLINVNIPNIPKSKIKGIKVCEQGVRFYTQEVTQCRDPRGKQYYWVGGPYRGYEKVGYTDCQAVDEGHVSVTPLTINCTHREMLKQVENTFHAN